MTAPSAWRTASAMPWPRFGGFASTAMRAGAMVGLPRHHPAAMVRSGGTARRNTDDAKPRRPLAGSSPRGVPWAGEGGAPFGTRIPAFKDALSQEQIWQIIAYMRAGFPALGAGGQQ